MEVEPFVATFNLCKKRHRTQLLQIEDASFLAPTIHALRQAIDKQDRLRRSHSVTSILCRQLQHTCCQSNQRNPLSLHKSFSEWMQYILEM